MVKNILVIDDVKEQAEGLSKALNKAMPECTFENYYEESSILSAIENRFYSIAIVDIRMDEFTFDGIDLVKKIFTVNPFASVIIVSAFKDEYFFKLKEVLTSGKIIDVQNKELLDTWIPKLKDTINSYYDKINSDPYEVNKALLSYYSETKNEVDTFKKGIMFEHFVSLLFQSIGFSSVMKRVIDKSLNEVDLIVRNDIDDKFIYKFGKYILIECKNKPKDGVSKNDFIVFNNKVRKSNGLAELGIIMTTGYISKNTYIEAVRESGEGHKIIFLSNPEIEYLINSENRLSSFKKLIDSQVKDN